MKSIRHSSRTLFTPLRQPLASIVSALHDLNVI